MRIMTLLVGPGRPVDLHRCVTCEADVAKSVVP